MNILSNCTIFMLIICFTIYLNNKEQYRYRYVCDKRYNETQCKKLGFFAKWRKDINCCDVDSSW